MEGPALLVFPPGQPFFSDVFGRLASCLSQAQVAAKAGLQAAWFSISTAGPRSRSFDNLRARAGNLLEAQLVTSNIIELVRSRLARPKRVEPFILILQST